MFARAVLLLLLACLPARAAEPVLIFAAASLADSLAAITPLLRAKGLEPRVSVASSSLLARQILEGAPADVFIAADLESMERVVAQGRAINPAAVGNELVLVAPAHSAIGELPLTLPALTAVLGATGRLATGDPDTVPAGRYAAQALETLKLEALRPRLAGAANVRAALTFVARGEAPLGIVYQTDAKAEPRVRVIARFPAGSHAPIVYPVASVSGRPAAALALEVLRSPEASAIFRQAGFRAGF